MNLKESDIVINNEKIQELKKTDIKFKNGVGKNIKIIKINKKIK